MWRGAPDFNRESVTAISEESMLEGDEFNIAFLESKKGAHFLKD